MQKLTDAQIASLHFAGDKHARPWGGKTFGHPPKAALLATVRFGLVARVGHPNMDLYQRTDAGRAVLASLPARPDPEEREAQGG